MANKIEIKLQGHEKFSLREGWLSKGLALASENPKCFLEKTAPEDFGVGSNMVKAIKYWMVAFNLINTSGELTDLGRIILKYDPFFEDIFTLWILHSNIAKNVEKATSWYMFFNKLDEEEYDKNQIFDSINREIKKYVMGQTYSENSVKSDVDVLLNMYSKQKIVINPEDNNSSPLVALGLLKAIDGKYVKTSPDFRVINEWVILYEVAILLEDKNEISLEKLTYGAKSVSMIYNINSLTINEYLDKLDSYGYIHVNRTAGLDMIYRTKEFTSLSVIEEYFNK